MDTRFSGPAKAKYFAKHVTQKIIGLIPYGFVAQENIKKRLGHWSGRSPEGVYLERLQSQIERFTAHSIEPPKVVVEQGTGWSGCDLIIFYLGGAERVLTYDSRPWLRSELFRQAAIEILQNLDVLNGWNGICSETLRSRAEQLQNSLDKPFEKLLESLSIEYRVTMDFSYTQAPEESVDLFYSYSTLQRIPPKNLEKIVAQSRRLLRTGGMNCHRVHMHDFHHITDKRVPRFYYLTLSDRTWNLMTSTYLNYQNRLRLQEFVDLFEGFTVETDNLRCWPEDVEYVKSNLSARYPDLTPDQIAIWQADIFAQKL
ncbi:class I SAM-dependent methyltransferase [Lentisalinibacter salinarum]|uniref:class I SAM-dependent methyltransferase n=1 Tax=Lentisalinibacter salinarum TaxID=2992239 RepID=UPI00386B131A